MLAAISADDTEDAGELAEELELTFPLLSDPRLSVIRAYGVEDAANEVAWPAMFIVHDGRIAWRNIVRNYKERPTVEQVLEALDTVGANSRQPARAAQEGKR